MADWRHIRAHKISSERPNDWPQGVRGISQEGLSLLGINEATGQLYCDYSQSGRAICFGRYTGALDSCVCSRRCFRHVRSKRRTFRN